MTTLAIVGLVLKYIPSLINMAEGLFSWKSKSGADKKAFVTDSLKSVVTGMQTESKGPQAVTWDHYAPIVDAAIDETVAEANKLGAFTDPTAMAQNNSGS